MVLGLASAELLSLAPSEEHVAGQTMASMPRGASPECSISLLTVPAQDWATAQLVAVPWGVVPAAPLLAAHLLVATAVSTQAGAQAPAGVGVGVEPVAAWPAQSQLLQEP